jgi:hypothetical protein
MIAEECLQPWDGGPLLRAIYFATLVWPTSMPSLRSSPWILGAPHNGLAMLISRISRRISNGTVGRPQRRLDFQRQYDLKPERCQRITVSGRTIASASYILGNSRQTPPQYQSVNRDEGRSPGTGSPQHIDLLPQDQNFCLKRNARPQQADHHSKDHSA